MNLIMMMIVVRKRNDGWCEQKKRIIYSRISNTLKFILINSPIHTHIYSCYLQLLQQNTMQQSSKPQPPTTSLPIPFYLQQTTSPFRRSTELKPLLKPLPLPPLHPSNLLLLTPQKKPLDKSLDLEFLLSEIPTRKSQVHSPSNLRWVDHPQKQQQLPDKKQMEYESNKGGVLKNDPTTTTDKKRPRDLSKQINSNDILDVKLFIMPPIQKNKVLKCTLRRDKSGMKTFFPLFQLHTFRQRRPLLFAKKQSGNKTSNYRISTTKSDLDTKGPNYVGKVRSNFFGTDYVIYDSGDNPKHSPHTTHPRKVLAEVHYQNKFIMCSSGPKKIEAYIADPESPVQSTSNFRKLHKHNPNHIVSMTNKLPKWNEKLGAYLLDLEDRAVRPSIKNFILVHEENEEMILLLLGKVDDDNFNLDVCYPLSVLQAFGIVLSMFDFKLASE